MKIIVGNKWYNTPEGSSVKITRSISDPVPTCSVNIRDNASALNIIAPQEILVLDDQVTPNPTINYVENPDMNPYNTNWATGGFAGITFSQATGGINIIVSNASSGTYSVQQQTTDPTLFHPDPTQTYVLSVYVQGSGGNTNIEAYIALQWLDVLTNQIFGSGLTFNSAAPVSTTLTRYNFQLVPPSGAFYAKIQLGVTTTNNTNSGTITFTNVQFEPLWISTQAYPTPFCGPNQTNCQQLPHNPLWIRQYRKFAGFVTHTIPGDYHGNARTIQVNAVGYAWLASTIIGNDSFSSQTDSAIISSLLSKYFLNYGVQLCSTTSVVTGNSLTSFQLPWDDLRTGFDNLCSSSTFYWTIDYYWNFIYAPPGYFSMTISLICDNSAMPDMVTTYPAYAFSSEGDYTQPGSNILVFGAGSNTAQVIDPARVAQIGQISGYSLPATTSWMRKINESSLNSVTDCTQRGIAELIQYDYSRALYHLTTNVELIAGNGIRVTSSTDGLSATMLLLQQVTSSWIGTSELLADTWEYKADLGAVNRAATHMISRLFRLVNANSAATAISSVALAVLENMSVADSVATGSLATGYVATILADSPTAYYRLGELEGTVADDYSGNANQGTLHGGITLNQTTLLLHSPNGSGAMLFNGSTGYISLPLGMVPTGAHAWSLECWTKFTSIPANGFHILLGWGGTAVHAWGALSVNVSGGVPVFTLGTNSGDISSGTISANTTYHVCGTYDGTNTRLYVNSVLVAGPTAFALTLAQTWATIGAYQPGGPNSFSTSIIEECAYYTFALSSGQINTHYIAGTT